MSARAAWRLESLGFTRVYRYTPGKADWLANGLPGEGTKAQTRTVGDVARRGVPTFGLDDKVQDVREGVARAGWPMGVVVNHQNVVLGLVRLDDLAGDPEARVQSVMREGPTTYRLDPPAEETARHLKERQVESVLITTSDGVLVGVFFRADAEDRTDRGGR